MTLAETTSGWVRGQRFNGAVAFLGIPYGADTSGENRFRPPRRPRAWTGVRDATTFGHCAPQNGCLPASGRDAGYSEDCLTLNVWTPGPDRRGRPVMVWFHGGGFATGSGADGLLDGRWLAENFEIVLVTCNYRLGILGFAAHPDLCDNATGACGNWGLLDQIAVLRWVADNIGNLGGDPRRVTACGHSAGAMSVCDLLCAPAAVDLFSRVVAQGAGPSARPLERTTRKLDWLCGRLGASRVTDLRDVPLPALLAAQRDLASAGDSYAMRPTVDGSVLVSHPLMASASQRQALPLVIGTTREDIRHFYAGSPVIGRMTERALRARVASAIGIDRASVVIDRYRSARHMRGKSTAPGELFLAIEADRTLRAPALRLAEINSEMRQTTLVYRFDFPCAQELENMHGIDVLFAFGGGERHHGWPPEAAELAMFMRSSLLDWIGARAPISSGWPSYDDRHPTMIFDLPWGVAFAPDEPERSIWLLDELLV